MRGARIAVCRMALLAGGWEIVNACGFDQSLRRYLSIQFWYPFAKSPAGIASATPPLSAAYAGMTKSAGANPLADLRAAYQLIAGPEHDISQSEQAQFERAVAAARPAATTPKEREEVALIDAKIDLRAGAPERPEPLHRAKEKLRAFLKTAKTPEYVSEARGWLARVHFLLKEQTDAGKIYLDELHRGGSNISRERLLDSLQLTYGYDGGPELRRHLEEYFDTPEHAAFAISLVTNPRWRSYGQPEPAPPYEEINALLAKHARLFRMRNGAELLATLGMRTALRSADPAGALRIARTLPARSRLRSDPEFLWMLAASHFISRNYAAAERPLLALFRSRAALDTQRAAAAYGLCGVYMKTGNVVEQIRYALWPKDEVKRRNLEFDRDAVIEDMTIYWAASGWDLNLLLDIEAPVESLRAFLATHPSVPQVRLVRYALAVRLARADQYDEAAQIYTAISAVRRAPRMRRLAELHRAAQQPAAFEARYEFARLLFDHANGVYFNDSLWGGLQRYALYASTDTRLTREERLNLTAAERKLKDEQEELWRAYRILRDVIKEAGPTEVGRRSAELAIRCLRRINTDRFGREQEIRDADFELTRWLHNASRR